MNYPVSNTSVHKSDIDAVQRVLFTGWLTQGQAVGAFEKTFGAFYAREAAACSNGTTALHLALLALGIGKGDKVIVPAMTYVAAANAVTYCGAEPVFVDVDPDTWCLNIEQAMKVSAKAAIVVHLYGVPAPGIERLLDKMPVIEDTAEGLGGMRDGRPTGSHGTVATFSFFGNKIITCGEGGMVTSTDAALITRVKKLRGQGVDPERRYYHSEIGFNYRMTEMQAALGLSQFARLAALCDARDVIMKEYAKRLGPVLSLPRGFSGTQAPWLFTGMLPNDCDRDKVSLALRKCGIDTRPTFVPMHKLPMYKSTAKFPVSTLIGERGISLPTYPQLTANDARIISNETISVLEKVQCLVP